MAIGIRQAKVLLPTDRGDITTKINVNCTHRTVRENGTPSLPQEAPDFVSENDYSRALLSQENIIVTSHPLAQAPSYQALGNNDVLHAP